MLEDDMRVPATVERGLSSELLTGLGTSSAAPSASLSALPLDGVRRELLGIGVFSVSLHAS